MCNTTVAMLLHSGNYCLHAYNDVGNSSWVEGNRKACSIQQYSCAVTLQKGLVTGVSRWERRLCFMPREGMFKITAQLRCYTADTVGDGHIRIQRIAVGLTVMKAAPKCAGLHLA